MSNYNIWKRLLRTHVRSPARVFCVDFDAFPQLGGSHEEETTLAASGVNQHIVLVSALLLA
jgi:hypothetical protein